MKTNYLKESDLPSLENKLIQWYAPSYKANYGFWRYGLYGGFAAIINGEVKIIAGDDIKYFKASSIDKDTLTYSDDDRSITYEIKEFHDIQLLLDERKTAELKAKKKYDNGEKKSRFSEISGYKNQPRKENYKTPKEYNKALTYYIEEIKKRYSILVPYEKSAREIIKSFDKKILSLFK